jgi:hypothetical protein
MRKFFLLLASVSIAACATTGPAPVAPPPAAPVAASPPRTSPWLPQAGIPQPLAIDPATNPDTFWLIRQVDIAKEGPNSTLSSGPVYGLFACYRQPASKPGAPQCWLAQYIYRPEDLMWPGGVFQGLNGSLKPTGP